MLLYIMYELPGPLGRCIGLIGGLGVGAAVHYYRQLAKVHSARERVLNLVMIHADVKRVLGAVQAGDRDGLAAYLAGLIQRLLAAGAEFAVIPAVAPHIAIAELVALSPLPILSLIQEVKLDIEARGIRRVALFGTRFAVESRLFGQLENVDVVTPQPDEVDYIHDTYLQLVGTGAGSAMQHQGLSRLAHQLIERDAVEAIVLAGTELALVFDENDISFPNINGARLHLDAITRRALE
jgi:aspartate racemase